MSILKFIIIATVYWVPSNRTNLWVLGIVTSILKETNCRNVPLVDIVTQCPDPLRSGVLLADSLQLWVPQRFVWFISATESNSCKVRPLSSVILIQWRVDVGISRAEHHWRAVWAPEFCGTLVRHPNSTFPSAHSGFFSLLFHKLAPRAHLHKYPDC